MRGRPSSLKTIIEDYTDNIVYCSRILTNAKKKESPCEWTVNAYTNQMLHKAHQIAYLKEHFYYSPFDYTYEFVPQSVNHTVAWNIEVDIKYTFEAKLEYIENPTAENKKKLDYYQKLLREYMDKAEIAEFETYFGKWLLS